MKNWQNFDVPNDALTILSCNKNWSTDFIEFKRWSTNYKNSNGTLSRMRERKVGWVTGASPRRVVDIVGIDYYLGEISILAKVLYTFKNVLVSNFRRNAYNIDQCLLYNSQIREFLDFLLWERADQDLVLAFGRDEAKAFEVLYRATGD